MKPQGSQSAAGIPAHEDRIVVGIDGSPGSRAALLAALDAAAQRKLQLDVLAVYPVAAPWTGGMPIATADMALVRSATESSAHTFLQETLAEAGKRGFADAVNVPTRVLTAAGPAAQALIDASDGAALLVVGSRGRGAVRSALLGSTALHCVTHARCPVLVVGDDFEVGIKAARIVVGVDGSDVSKAALRAALDEARRRDADVEVVSVFSPVFWAEMYALIPPDTDQIRTGVQQRTEETVREVLAGMDGAALPTPRIHTVVVEGVPSDVLESQARNASLLVVGNQGQAPVRGLLLGSVALHCVMHAPCPVLVVRVPTVREQPTSVAARSVVAGEA